MWSKIFTSSIFWLAFVCIGINLSVWFESDMHYLIALPLFVGGLIGILLYRIFNDPR